MFQRSMHSSICQECIIKNYWDLKKNTQYSMTQTILSRERTLKFQKTKKSHTFELHCELDYLFYTAFCEGKKIPREVILFVVYDENRFIHTGNVVETEFGGSIDVPNEMVVNARNKYLHKDKQLVLRFCYNMFAYYRIGATRDYTLGKEEQNDYASDMLALYNKREENGDFTLISMEGKKFPVHKCIWTARSTIPPGTHNVGTNIVYINFKSEVVEMAIRYAYIAELRDCPFEDLLSLLNFAHEFCMFYLSESTVFLLRAKFTEQNICKIYELDDTSRYRILKSYAADFEKNETIRKDKERKALIKMLKSECHRPCKSV